MISLNQEMQDHGRTLTARATQVTPTRFMLERNMDPISNNDIYLVLTQDEGEEGDGVISCWSEDDGNWFLDEARRDFPNKGELLYDITKAIRVQGPLKVKIGLLS